MIDLMRQSLGALPLSFFDIETTGLSSGDGHRICEVALVRVCGTQIEHTFDQLINPQRLPDPGAVAVHGISPELLDGAPAFAVVAPTILDIMHGSVVVAHNAPFDMDFLEAELRRLGIPLPMNPVIDTLQLARRLLQRSSYSLQSLSRDLHLDIPAHRAMQDVQALRGLFAYLCGRMHDLDIRTLEDVLRYQRGILPGEPEPETDTPIDQALREGRLLRIIYRSRSSPQAVERVIQPREIRRERSGLHVRAFCYLRNDQRTFAVRNIEWMELLDEPAKPDH